MRQRHAGGQHEGGNAGPIEPAQVGSGQAGLGRLGDLAGIVVERDDLRTPGDERVTGGETRGAEAENRELLSGKDRDRNHRSFSVDRPASASTKAMIQKRMTICASVQPSFSK